MLQQLTHDGRWKTDTVVLRSSGEIIFTVQESAVQFALMRLNPVSGVVERLNPQATTTEMEPAFSADGKKLAFVQSRANLNLRLILRDLKENKEAVFDAGSGFAGMRHPSVSPDGSRVIFSIPGSNGHHIDSVTIQGTDRKTLSQGGLNSWPSYSPDGQHIVFGSSRDGHFELYSMKADGSEVKRLTHSTAMNLRPRWSPDGREIVFVSLRDGMRSLYRMKADGSDVRRLTEHREGDDFPCWHPDGKRIVFIRQNAGKYDVFEMSLS